MKALFIIPLFTAAVIGVVAAGLAVAGVRFSPADPLCAGIIAAVTGIVAMMPIILGRPSDQALAFQFALFGTVMHMLLALALGVTLMATNMVQHDNRLGFWLVGGYWVSLFVTVGQLRRLVLAAPLAKAEK
jgi:hypothetical protein